MRLMNVCLDESFLVGMKLLNFLNSRRQLYFWNKMLCCYIALNTYHYENCQQANSRQAESAVNIPSGKHKLPLNFEYFI